MRQLRLRAAYDANIDFNRGLFIVGLVVSFGVAIWLTLSPAKSPKSASEPAPRNKVYLGHRGVQPVLGNDWIERHNAYVERARRGSVDLLFVGDSITEAWTGLGRPIWQQRYTPLHAANFGISGDRTEHLLWRLQNGELQGIQPKVAVVLIGTNNLGREPEGDTPEEVTEGVAQVLLEFKKQTPRTKILLLGIFPREPSPGDDRRRTIAQINRRLAMLEDGQRVFFLDIGKKFLNADGSLSPAVMPDFLHPNREGYAIWGEAMAGKLSELIGDGGRLATVSWRDSGVAQNTR